MMCCSVAPQSRSEDGHIGAEPADAAGRPTTTPDGPPGQPRRPRPRRPVPTGRRTGTAGNRLRRATMEVVPPDELTADAPREACGVFGVCAPGSQVAHLTFDGLYALQHRGQESAGMAVSDGTEMMVVKDMGLVTNVFNERNLAGLQGHLAIGHTRYSTTGASTWHNAQPVYRTSSPGRDLGAARWPSPSATTAT